MNDERRLREAFVSVEVDEQFAKAEVRMRDGSRLSFCHRVDERWARAEPAADGGALAGQLLAGIAGFRLNAKHLDVQFADGSRWELRLGGRK